MNDINSRKEAIIRSRFPKAEIVDPSDDFVAPQGLTRTVRAEAMIRKWSSHEFTRSFAEPEYAGDSVSQHDISFAVIKLGDDPVTGQDRLQTVIIDETAGEIIAVSG